MHAKRLKGGITTIQFTMDIQVPEAPRKSPKGNTYDSDEKEGWLCKVRTVRR